MSTPTMHPYRVEYDFNGERQSVHVTAKSRSSARHDAWLTTGAADCDVPYMEFARTVRSIRKLERMPLSKGQREANEWNALHPVGSAVVYWTGFREGPGVRSVTRGRARALSPSHTSVHVEGHGSCIALSHVEVVDPSVELEDER